jgi:hypothetical protein
MIKDNYCTVCDIEFRVRHDIDDDTYIVMYCPFCSEELDTTMQEQDALNYDEELED